jgi:hypothetical protein
MKYERSGKSGNDSFRLRERSAAIQEAGSEEMVKLIICFCFKCVLCVVFVWIASSYLLAKTGAETTEKITTGAENLEKKKMNKTSAKRKEWRKRNR